MKYLRMNKLGNPITFLGIIQDHSLLILDKLGLDRLAKDRLRLII